MRSTGVTWCPHRLLGPRLLSVGSEGVAPISRAPGALPVDLSGKKALSSTTQPNEKLLVHAATSSWYESVSLVRNSQSRGSQLISGDLFPSVNAFTSGSTNRRRSPNPAIVNDQSSNSSITPTQLKYIGKVVSITKDQGLCLVLRREPKD